MSVSERELPELAASGDGELLRVRVQPRSSPWGTTSRNKRVRVAGESLDEARAGLGLAYRDG